MNVVLKVRKRTQCEWATLFVIFMPFTFGLLIDGLGFSGLVKYVVDIVWLFLLFMMTVGHTALPNKESKRLLRHTLCFAAVTLIGAIVALQSPLYYLWGFRNNFRFFVLFFACILYLKKESVDTYLRAFDILFYIDVLVCLFQYFVLGYKQDYLGGIFGVHTGSNGTTLVFFSIVIAKSILQYMNHKELFVVTAIKCSLALLVAAFAELKVFFVVLIVIVSMSALITKFSVKKYIFFLLAMLAMLMGVRLLENLFKNFANWFNWENMLDILTSEKGYTGRGDVNRLTGIPIAWNRFLTTWWKRLFGLGLGNCDVSNFDFLSTPFYNKYNYLHYNWFSAIFMFLETGIIGLFCYCTFFIRVFTQAVRVRRNNKQREFTCQLAQIMAIVSLLIIVYNSSLRTESGYMMFFILSLPFIKEEKVVNLTT